MSAPDATTSSRAAQYGLSVEDYTAFVADMAAMEREHLTAREVNEHWEQQHKAAVASFDPNPDLEAPL